MDAQARIALSKFLSFVLRHRPEAAGVELDPNGWVAIDDLLAGAARVGRSFSRAELLEVVATNAKRRFAISDDGVRIRASQGHSVEVDLAYERAEPPAVLFHGTVARSLDPIRETGLYKMSRHHVHLSADAATAAAVGSRRGKAIVLRVAAGAMHRAGHAFFRAANGVWLTDHVPPEYLELPVAPTKKSSGD